MDAEVICREMGYDGLTSWDYGNYWEIQESFPIVLDEISCSADSPFASCDFYVRHDCDHSDDVHLVCAFNETGIYF